MSQAHSTFVFENQEFTLGTNELTNSEVTISILNRSDLDDSEIAIALLTEDDSKASIDLRSLNDFDESIDYYRYLISEELLENQIKIFEKKSITSPSLELQKKINMSYTFLKFLKIEKNKIEKNKAAEVEKLHTTFEAQLKIHYPFYQKDIDRLAKIEYALKVQMAARDKHASQEEIIASLIERYNTFIFEHQRICFGIRAYINKFVSVKFQENILDKKILTAIMPKIDSHAKMESDKKIENNTKTNYLTNNNVNVQVKSTLPPVKGATTLNKKAPKQNAEMSEIKIRFPTITNFNNNDLSPTVTNKTQSRPTKKS